MLLTLPGRLWRSTVARRAGSVQARSSLPMNRMPTCLHCGDVIGVYEPLVHVGEDGIARTSSYAAEPGLARESGARYHHVCYLAVVEAQSGPDGQLS